MEVTNPPPQVNLIDNDFGNVFELSLFATNIREVRNVLESILCF
jgi:hypothetical protein